MLEVRETTPKEAISKQEIVRELARENDLPIAVVNKLLSDLGDIYIREVLSTGAWNLKPFPIVTRKVLKSRNYTHPQTKDTQLVQDTCYLSAKITDSVKKAHRSVFKELLKEQ